MLACVSGRVLRRSNAKGRLTRDAEQLVLQASDIKRNCSLSRPYYTVLRDSRLLWNEAQRLSVTGFEVMDGEEDRSRDEWA